MKAVVAAFNQEKALLGAFSVITNLRMELGWNFLRLGYSDNKVQGCYYPATDPLEADELLVAHSLVGLEAAGRALHGAPVAVAVAAAPVVLAAQRAHVEAAVAVAARTLTANQR